MYSTFGCKASFTVSCYDDPQNDYFCHFKYIYMKRVKTLLKGTIENLVTDVVAETLYMLHFAECRHFSSIFDNLSEGLYSCGRKPSHVFNIKSGETIKVQLLFHVSVICVN